MEPNFRSGLFGPVFPVMVGLDMNSIQSGHPGRAPPGFVKNVIGVTNVIFKSRFAVGKPIKPSFPP